MNHKLLLIGVGGAGINIIDSLLPSTAFETLVVDSGIQALDNSKSSHQVYLGRILLNHKERIRWSLDAEMRRISRLITGAETVVIMGGVAGSVGSIGMTKIARQSMDMGKTTICLAIEPFEMEGFSRSKVAANTVDQLRPDVDMLLSLSNEDLIDMNPDIVLKEAFGMMNELIKDMVSGLQEDPDNYAQVLDKIRERGLTVA